MKRLSARSGLLALGVAGFLASAAGPAAIAAEASVYKWVDAQGVPHYSDQPPVNSASEALSIHYRKTDRSAQQARVKAKAEVENAADVKDGQQSGADATDDSDRQKVLAERESNCKAAKLRVNNYTNARRLYKPGPNGERTYLTDEEIDAERADAQRSVEEWCDNG